MKLSSGPGIYKNYIIQMGMINGKQYFIEHSDLSKLQEIDNGKITNSINSNNYFYNNNQQIFFNSSDYPNSILLGKNSIELLHGNKKFGYYLHRVNNKIIYQLGNTSILIGSSPIIENSAFFIDSLYYKIFNKNNINELFCLEYGKIKYKCQLLGEIEPAKISKLKFIYTYNNKYYAQIDNELYELTIQEKRSIFCKKILYLPPNFLINRIVYSKKLNIYVLSSLSDGLILYQPTLFENLQVASNSNTINRNINMVHAFQPMPQLGYISAYALNTTVKKEIFTGWNINSHCIPASASKNIIFPYNNKLCVYDSNFTFKSVLKPFSDIRDHPRFYCNSNTNVFLIFDNSIYFYDNNFNLLRTVKMPFQKYWHYSYYYNNKIILASNDGVFEYNIETNSFTELKILKKLFIRNISKFQNFLIIFVKDIGWFKYYNNTLITLPLDPNNFLHQAHALFEDNLGYCWISSDHGIFKISAQQLFQYKSPKDAISFLHYTVNNGLKTNELNGGCTPSGHKLPTGEIMFGSINGILKIYPKNFVLTGYQNLFIEESYLNGQLIDLNNYKIPNKYLTLRLYVTSPNLMQNNHRLLQYSVNNTSWINLVNQEYVDLNQMKFGKYNITFRLFDQLNNKTTCTKIIYFNILPPWYLNKLFILSICIVLFILVYFIFQRQKFKALKKQESLEQLVQSRTSELRHYVKHVEEISKFNQQLSQSIVHDIRSPMLFLQQLAKRLKKTNITDTESNKIIETLISGISELTKHSTNLLTWFQMNIDSSKSNIEQFDTELFLLELSEEYKPLANEKGLYLNCKCDSSNFSSNKIYLTVIIRNLLDNAIKFTESGGIEIEAATIDNSLKLSVCDTGIGMTEQEIQFALNSNEQNSPRNGENGWGLFFVINFVNYLQGTISVSNNLPNGLKVEIVIPNSNTD